MSDSWTELYDPKQGRKFRQIPYLGTCPECKKNNGHQIDCSKVTMENLARLAKISQKQEENAKEKSNRYWEMLQQATGKLSILRHENNKLRKENDRLRNQEKDQKKVNAKQSVIPKLVKQQEVVAYPKCKKCNGHGSIEGPSDSGYTDCPSCNGKGY